MECLVLLVTAVVWAFSLVSVKQERKSKKGQTTHMHNNNNKDTREIDKQLQWVKRIAARVMVGEGLVGRVAMEAEIEILTPAFAIGM
jgi:hypothetical protein